MINSPLDSTIIDVMAKINRESETAKSGDPASLGVHAAVPGYTPKYAKHQKSRSSNYQDTLARMFIRVPKGGYNSFLAGLDARAQRVAKVLCGDNAGTGGIGYIDFFLQRVNHSLAEKYQVSETLGDSYVAYFFGGAAPTWQYSGSLLNTFQDDWAKSFFSMYSSLGRGTQLARRGLVLSLKYDCMIVTGAMLNFTWGLDSSNEVVNPFSFDFLVKNVTVFYDSLTTPTKLTQENTFTPEGVKLITSGFAGGAPKNMYIGVPPVTIPGLSPATQQEQSIQTDDQYWEAMLGIEDNLQTMQL